MFSSQKHMMPSFPPSVIQTWSTMKRLMSISSVQVRLTDSYSVPLCWTSLTQQPSHCFTAGMSRVWAVKTKGSPHRGSSLVLQSKQSISLPAELYRELRLRPVVGNINTHTYTHSLRVRGWQRPGRPSAGLERIIMSSLYHSCQLCSFPYL